MKQIFILLALLMMAPFIKAQSGDISGKVKDARDGLGIDNVTVELIDTTGKATGHGSKADSDGNYSISPLSPGVYNIRVSAPGFIAITITRIKVSADKTSFIDAPLQPDPKAVVAKKKHPHYHKMVTY